MKVPEYGPRGARALPGPDNEVDRLLKGRPGRVDLIKIPKPAFSVGQRVRFKLDPSKPPGEVIRVARKPNGFFQGYVVQLPNGGKTGILGEDALEAVE